MWTCLWEHGHRTAAPRNWLRNWNSARAQDLFVRSSDHRAGEGAIPADPFAGRRGRDRRRRLSLEGEASIESRTRFAHGVFFIDPFAQASLARSQLKSRRPFGSAAFRSAERPGFEPGVPITKYGSLANYWFQPLTHLSRWPVSATGRQI